MDIESTKQSVRDCLREAVGFASIGVADEGFDCVEASAVVFRALKDEGLSPDVYCGSVSTKKEGVVMPHYWVMLETLAGDVFIDLTLRAWLQSAEGMHYAGVFFLEEAEKLGVEYRGVRDDALDCLHMCPTMEALAEAISVDDPFGVLRPAAA